jgi:DNA-binding transcriptional LysR family regulator
MAFSLRQIRYFVAIAELGSLSAAARELSVSQSSIAVGIQDLEQELACALFERHARGMEPTVKGHQFLRHARKILADVADARRSLEEVSEPPLGRLNLGVTSLVAGYVVAELLARFRRAFPGVDISIVEDSRDDLEHLLVSGELDAAALILPGERPSPALEACVLQTSPYRLWLPLGHPLTRQQRVSFAALAPLPHIVLAADEIAETAESRWARLGIRPRVLLRTRSVEAVRSLVATGAGVAILPDLAFRPWSLEGDKLEARPLEEAVRPALVGVTWRRGSALSPTVRSFLSIVQAHRHAEDGGA